MNNLHLAVPEYTPVSLFLYNRISAHPKSLHLRVQLTRYYQYIEVFSGYYHKLMQLNSTYVHGLHV